MKKKQSCNEASLKNLCKSSAKIDFLSINTKTTDSDYINNGTKDFYVPLLSARQMSYNRFEQYVRTQFGSTVVATPVP